MRETAVAEEALGRLVDGWLRKTEHVVMNTGLNPAAVVRAAVGERSNLPLESCDCEYVWVRKSKESASIRGWKDTAQL